MGQETRLRGKWRMGGIKTMNSTSLLAKKKKRNRTVAGEKYRAEKKMFVFERDMKVFK